MWILILVILSKNNITSTSVKFQENVNCLQAIDKLLEMEKTGIKIQARCVKE